MAALLSAVMIYSATTYVVLKHKDDVREMTIWFLSPSWLSFLGLLVELATTGITLKTCFAVMSSDIDDHKQDIFWGSR